MATDTEDVTTLFAELGDLEKDFAQVELDACRFASAGIPV